MSADFEKPNTIDPEVSKRLIAWKESKIKGLDSCFYTSIKINGKNLLGSISAPWGVHFISGDILIPLHARPGHSRAVALHNQRQITNTQDIANVYKELGLDNETLYKDSIRTSSQGMKGELSLYIHTKPSYNFQTLNTLYLPAEERVDILAGQIAKVLDGVKISPVSDIELRLFTC